MSLFDEQPYKLPGQTPMQAFATPPQQQQQQQDPFTQVLMSLINGGQQQQQQQSGGIDFASLLQSLEPKHIGTNGLPVTPENPYGAPKGFFSTPEQVQANLASGRTSNTINPANVAYNQQRGTPQSQVVQDPMAMMASLIGQGNNENFNTPFGTVGRQPEFQDPAQAPGTSPGFASAMNLKNRSPFAGLLY